MQDKRPPTVKNGDAEDRRRNGTGIRCHRVGRHATEVIATARQAPVLLRLGLMTRMIRIIVLMLSVRDRLIGRDETERNIRTSAAQCQGEQHYQTSDKD